MFTSTIILILTIIWFISTISHVVLDYKKITNNFPVKHGSYLLEIIIPPIISFILCKQLINITLFVFTVKFILATFMLWTINWLIIDIYLNTLRDKNINYFSKDKNSAFTDKILKYSPLNAIPTKIVLFLVMLIGFLVV